MFLSRNKTEKNKLVDPICGMDLHEDEVRYRTEHKG
jgi:YHS domain-containing protein